MVDYTDFIKLHELSKSKILRKEESTEQVIAAVDEEITKDERRKKVVGSV